MSSNKQIPIAFYTLEVAILASWFCLFVFIGWISWQTGLFQANSLDVANAGKWQATSWSKCIGKCGTNGKQIRKIRCVNTTGNKILSVGSCLQPVPETSKNCESTSCQQINITKNNMVTHLHQDKVEYSFTEGIEKSDWNDPIIGYHKWEFEDQEFNIYQQFLMLDACKKDQNCISLLGKDELYNFREILEKLNSKQQSEVQSAKDKKFIIKIESLPRWSATNWSACYADECDTDKGVQERSIMCRIVLFSSAPTEYCPSSLPQTLKPCAAAVISCPKDPDKKEKEDTKEAKELEKLRDAIAEEKKKQEELSKEIEGQQLTQEQAQAAQAAQGTAGGSSGPGGSQSPGGKSGGTNSGSSNAPVTGTPPTGNAKCAFLEKPKPSPDDTAYQGGKFTRQIKDPCAIGMTKKECAAIQRLIKYAQPKAKIRETGRSWAQHQKNLASNASKIRVSKHTWGGATDYDGSNAELRRMAQVWLGKVQPECGALVWGGNWKSFFDPYHFEVKERSNSVTAPIPIITAADKQ